MACVPALAILGVLPVVSAAGVQQVSAGIEHTCAIVTSGVLKCFGYGAYGQLGSGMSTSDMGQIYQVNLGTGKTAKQVSAGHGNTCFVLNDGSLKCCGGRELNSVDLGSAQTAKQVSVGRHTCAILSDGSLGCFGRGEYGQLGSGGTDYVFSANLSLVDLGTGKTAKQVSAGDKHTCAILNDDSLKCWGEGNQGQLGVVAGKYPETRIGNEPGEMGDNLTAVDLGTGKTAKQVAVGSEHTCVILNDDSLVCFGLGDRGQLGHGGYVTSIGPDDMGDKLPKVDLGTDKTAKQVSTGAYHTCVVLNDDSLKCFGGGAFGKLGTSKAENVWSAGDALALGSAGISFGNAQQRASAMLIAFAACSSFW